MENIEKSIIVEMIFNKYVDNIKILEDNMYNELYDTTYTIKRNLLDIDLEEDEEIKIPKEANYYGEISFLNKIIKQIEDINYIYISMAAIKHITDIKVLELYYKEIRSDFERSERELIENLIRTTKEIENF
jgi:hypothetical protein